MIHRIFPSKDTFLTNYRRNNVPQTGSNFGAAELLQVFRIAPVTGSSGVIVSGSLARVLVEFDISQFSSLTASKDMPSDATYHLRLRNLEHGMRLPASFGIEVEQLGRAWDEGRGLDVDDFADKGYANWDRSRSNVFWTAPGGDLSSTRLVSVAHFDDGHEDLDVDVTPLVNNWLTGGTPNYGFMVRLSSSLESGSLDYYTKMFYSRHSKRPDRWPYLEARWDDSLRDDRNNFVYDYTGSLFLYHRVRGQLTDIVGLGTGSNVVTVRIVDASGTVKTVSGSHTGRTGIYSASFALATASYSGSTFNDIWFSGSSWYLTGTFTPTDEFSQQTASPARYVVHVKNLKKEYERDEVTRLDLYVRRHDYFPSAYATASSGPHGTVWTKAYYRVVNDRTDEVVVPFGTGSVETTRLSYDQNGNYLRLRMAALPPREVYRISFLVHADGEQKLIDENFKFRVV
jgi:hypothetical protein